jgi:hypothetical protein
MYLHSFPLGSSTGVGPWQALPWGVQHRWNHHTNLETFGLQKHSKLMDALVCHISHLLTEGVCSVQGEIHLGNNIKQSSHHGAWHLSLVSPPADIIMIIT